MLLFFFTFVFFNSLNYIINLISPILFYALAQFSSVNCFWNRYMYFVFIGYFQNSLKPTVYLLSDGLGVLPVFLFKN